MVLLASAVVLLTLGVWRGLLAGDGGRVFPGGCGAFGAPLSPPGSSAAAHSSQEPRPAEGGDAASAEPSRIDVTAATTSE